MRRRIRAGICLPCVVKILYDPSDQKMKVWLQLFDTGRILIKDGIITGAGNQLDHQIDDELRVVEPAAGAGDHLLVDLSGGDSVRSFFFCHGAAEDPPA